MGVVIGVCRIKLAECQARVPVTDLLGIPAMIQWIESDFNNLGTRGGMIFSEAHSRAVSVIETGSIQGAGHFSYVNCLLSRH